MPTMKPLRAVVIVITLAIGSTICAPLAWAQGSSPAPAAAEAPAEEAVRTAPVIVDGVALFRVRGVSALPAEERARLISDRIASVAGNPALTPDSLRIEETELASRILADRQLVLGVYDADGQVEGVRRQVLALTHVDRIRTAIVAYRAEHTGAAVQRAAVRAGGSGGDRRPPGARRLLAMAASRPGDRGAVPAPRRGVDGEVPRRDECDLGLDLGSPGAQVRANGRPCGGGLPCRRVRARAVSSDAADRLEPRPVGAGSAHHDVDGIRGHDPEPDLPRHSVLPRAARPDDHPAVLRSDRAAADPRRSIRPGMGDADLQARSAARDRLRHRRRLSLHPGSSRKPSRGSRCSWAWCSRWGRRRSSPT